LLDTHGAKGVCLVGAGAPVNSALPAVPFYPNLPLDEEDDETAARYYNHLRQRGVQGAGIDLLIWAAAIRHGLKIFTTDKDLANYAKHIPIRLHRPRGRA